MITIVVPCNYCVFLIAWFYTFTFSTDADCGCIYTNKNYHGILPWIWA